MGQKNDVLDWIRIPHEKGQILGEMIWHNETECSIFRAKKTTEWIKLLFEMVTENPVLDGRACNRHLTNTVEQLCAAAMNGSVTTVDDAA